MFSTRVLTSKSVVLNLSTCVLTSKSVVLNLSTCVLAIIICKIRGGIAHNHHIADGLPQKVIVSEDYSPNIMR